MDRRSLCLVGGRLLWGRGEGNGGTGGGRETKVERNGAMAANGLFKRTFFTDRLAPDFSTVASGGRLTLPFPPLPPHSRKFLIAYNINLLGTKEQANRIAFNVREKGRGPTKPGRFKNVAGIGWYVEEYGMSQISVNCTDFEVTNIHTVYESCKEDAEGMNLAVCGSELVGLVPLEVRGRGQSDSSAGHKIIVNDTSPRSFRRPLPPHSASWTLQITTSRRRTSSW